MLSSFAQHSAGEGLLSLVHTMLVFLISKLTTENKSCHLHEQQSFSFVNVWDRVSSRLSTCRAIPRTQKLGLTVLRMHTGQSFPLLFQR